MPHLNLNRTATGLAALVLLSGCAAATNDAPTSEPDPTPTANSSTPPSADSFDGTNKYFPVGVGNTWVYRLQDAFSEATVTDTMSAVERQDTDVIATIDRTIDDETVSYDFVFHEDGSVSQPLSYLLGGAPGFFEWPATAEFEAGTPSTGTFPVGDGEVKFSIVGQGTENVTVPLGTFDSRKLVQNVLITGGGYVDVPWVPTFWLSPGVGIVRLELPDYRFGPDYPKTYFDLVSFTPGS